VTRIPTARRGVAVVAAAVVLSALGLGLSPGAQAVGPDAAARSAIVDCIPGLDGTSPPGSMAPSEVAGAFFDPSSARPPADARGAATPPASGGAPPNTLASYGWAGFSWPDYEPGCSATISLDDRLTGTLARASLSMLVWANAATTGASRYAYDPATYDPVDQLAKSVDSGIGDGFARPGFWIVALLLGAALVWTADRRSPRHHAQVATVVLALGLSVVTVSTWNATLGPTADRAVLTVVSWANTAATPGAEATGADVDAGQQIGESLRTNIVLRTWRSGVFGPGDATADEYADALFAAGAISTTEAAAAGRDSEALGRLADADKAAYEQIAGQVKENDERAYGYLAGKHNGARLFYATLGWLTWLWAASFQTVAAFATAYALTLVRLVLGLWSAIALVALFRPRYALRAVGLLVGALVAGVGLSVVAAGARLAYGQLLSTASAANTWVTVGVGLVVCAATWVIAWPLFRVLPGTPERLRRIGGRRVRPGDEAGADGQEGSEEPPGTSLVGTGGGRFGGLSGTGEPGIPAEATPGRPAVGILAAAAEGLPGRRRDGVPLALPSGSSTSRPDGEGTGTPGGAASTIVLPDAGDRAALPAGVGAPAGAGGAGGPGGGQSLVVRTAGSASTAGTASTAAAATGGSSSAADGQPGLPAGTTPGTRVGAEAGPSDRRGSYGAAAPSPGRALVQSVPRPPRKLVPALYPVYVPRRTDPDAPALLPGRAPMKALPAEPSTPDDPSGAPR